MVFKRRGVISALVIVHRKEIGSHMVEESIIVIDVIHTINISEAKKRNFQECTDRDETLKQSGILVSRKESLNNKEGARIHIRPRDQKCSEE
ncbi:hypothetical protein Bhyg_09042 [Pseudolycoriella hygida]|uniref:Uncharacterized protein n=1 Tax=Pseudolycoriella hygida TaxID=35572 RepID=A0A9Q0N710_9DIPT|nr:hypothetical protein Bhyg_09042 [Pseudolycoriella hygida]